MMIHNCAGKIADQSMATQICTECYDETCIHLVYLLQRRLAWHSTYVFIGIQGIMVTTNTCML